jgi:hypothetical protein
MPKCYQEIKKSKVLYKMYGDGNIIFRCKPI